MLYDNKIEILKSIALNSIIKILSYLFCFINKVIFYFILHKNDMLLIAFVPIKYICQINFVKNAFNITS